MEKMMVVFCDYMVICSENQNLDRKSEIKLNISMLEQMRVREDENKVLLFFTGNDDNFKNKIKSLALEFSSMIKDEDIILGNHFDHKATYSSDGTKSYNTETSLPTLPNTIIGDKIRKQLEQLSLFYKIGSVRIINNNIGDTHTLTEDLNKLNIQMIQYKFNPFETEAIDNININCNQNMMYANCSNFRALNVLLNHELGTMNLETKDRAEVIYKKAGIV
jgi:hypothetical protein